MKALLHGRRSPDDRGAAAAEYALLVTLIAAVILGSVGALGIDLRNVFRDSCRDFSNAARTLGPC